MGQIVFLDLGGHVPTGTGHVHTKLPNRSEIYYKSTQRTFKNRFLENERSKSDLKT